MRVSAATSAPPHAPELGLLARLLGPVHVTGVFWFRLHRFGARVLPEWLKRAAMLAFTLFFTVALRSIRDAVASNLEAVLGSCGFVERQRRIFRTLYLFAWCLTERYERLVGPVPFAIEHRAGDAWDRLAGAGRGLILVTGHLGNWELGSGAAPERGAAVVHVVREEELDPRAQRFIERLLAERSGDRYVTHFAARDPLLGIALLEALRRGEVVALQGDRPRSGGRTVDLELFGRPFSIPAGPMALARKAGVPLLPAFVLREGRRRYGVWFDRPIEVPATADRDADLRQAGERIVTALEAVIRRAPHQWFCFRRLWPAGWPADQPAAGSEPLTESPGKSPERSPGPPSPGPSSSQVPSVPAATTGPPAAPVPLKLTSNRYSRNGGAPPAGTTRAVSPVPAASRPGDSRVPRTRTR
jgi:KDO2-lipid IV(A) lauroyltransferase